MFDTIIMGGGPAGSSTAGLLAQAGANVLVIERSRFPRFHIGESLLPRSLPLLDKLGVTFKSSELQYKSGAEFFDEADGSYANYPFADALPGLRRDHAFQVERAVFDERLLRRASELGATVHEEEQVTRVVTEETGVTVETDKGRYRGRYCVDATGQAAFFAKRSKTVAPYQDFGRGAVFSHFDNLTDDANEVLGSDGNIKVIMLSDGWAWLIPLTGRRLSVGVVTRERKLSEDSIDELLASSPLTNRAVRGAERLSTQLTGNFSFRNTKPHGARFCCIGDAACFLDPVFSSGVALAMEGAESTSAALLPALERGTEARPDLMAEAEAHMNCAYRNIGALVYAFYHTKMIRNLFFARRPNPQLRAGLISILAGDIWRDDNEFQTMLNRSRRRNPVA